MPLKGVEEMLDPVTCEPYKWEVTLGRKAEPGLAT